MRSDESRQQESEPETDNTSTDDHAGRAAENQPDDACSIRAEGGTNSDFARATHGSKADETVERDSRQRHAAAQTVVHGQEIDPDVAIAALDEVSFAEVADVAAGISEAASVACVGPHEVDDFAAV